MKKAFTIIELIVAMTIIVILLAGSGYVFHTAVQAERSARATAEIARKLRGITAQLNTDFKGIKYEGQMFFAWEPSEVYDFTGTVIERYERFDQMMFFADGNFNSYRDNPLVEGKIARVQYSLAVNSDGDPPSLQEPSKRVLARVQHIKTPVELASMPVPDLDPATFYLYDPGPPETGFIPHERDYEYDNTEIDEWKNMDIHVSEEILTVISNLSVDIIDDDLNPNTRDVGGVIGSSGTPTGVYADASDSKTIHKILCEGVGEFIIQDWRWCDDPLPEGPRWRWYPENDADGDGDYDSHDDFAPDGSGGIDTSLANGWIYPGDDTFFDYFGRAFKFTFTLYDSYGVFPEGKTFSHIIYLRQD